MGNEKPDGKGDDGIGRETISVSSLIDRSYLRRFRNSSASALFALLVPLSVFSQDLDFVKSQVDTLAGTAFFGRGYVNNGSNLAADYLATQYKQAGAQSIGESYFQPFSFVVNTFPMETE